MLCHCDVILMSLKRGWVSHDVMAKELMNSHNIGCFSISMKKVGTLLDPIVYTITRSFKNVENLTFLTNSELCKPTHM